MLCGIRSLVAYKLEIYGVIFFATRTILFSPSENGLANLNTEKARPLQLILKLRGRLKEARAVWMILNFFFKINIRSCFLLKLISIEVSSKKNCKLFYVVQVFKFF